MLSGANLNFHGLRYVSERCELGEQREALLAVTIPERKGSFLQFCQLLGGRSVTEFNYRYADPDNASILVGVRLTRGISERQEIVSELSAGAMTPLIYPMTSWLNCTCVTWWAAVRRRP